MAREGDESNRGSYSLVLDPDGEAPLLNREQQQLYLNLIARGASPAGACQQLGLPPMSLVLTAEQDAAFAALLKRVKELLSQNVAAALYRAAMEGNVSAQTFYLKNLPPPEWPTDDALDTPPDSLDALDDDALLDRFREEATRLLAEVETDETRPPVGAAAP